MSVSLNISNASFTNKYADSIGGASSSGAWPTFYVDGELYSGIDNVRIDWTSLWADSSDMKYCDFHFASEDLIGGICDSVFNDNTVWQPLCQVDSCCNSDQWCSEDDILVIYSVGNYSSQAGASIYEFGELDLSIK